ncbi:MAG: gliding motility-associated C-terminal domain-containing protein [Bacteroidota bacterium]|nr:gliding motility-associated C-terminal domain-containing protein [Bacteroidota bacterium]
MNFKLIRYLCSLVSLLVLPCLLWATHNRAGEINFIQLDELTIKVIVITYTKESSTAADRDSILVFWGDGTSSRIKRSNGNGESLPNDIKKNLYTSTHTYPGRGSYKIGIMDPNRIDNILNVDPPNSVNIPFYIQTTVTLLNPIFQGLNHSVQLLQSPIDFACVGVVFQHNPAAYDEDGDSLSFELSVPLMDENTPVPNYLFPHQIQAGINNNLSLDTKNGTITWDAPQKAGEYNLAFIVHEYRNGVRIASTIRDMQILVRPDCGQNKPPQITAIQELCVTAGSKITIPIIIRDPDRTLRGRRIKVNVTGAPFNLTPPSSFIPNNIYTDTLINGIFEWQTNCTDIQNQFYTINIKATDNLFDTTGAFSIHIIHIKVTGPAPRSLTATIENTNMRLNWLFPYDCDSIAPKFQGFSVWRRVNSKLIIQDSCQPGLNASDYEKIVYLTKAVTNNKYTYLDTSVTSGKLYCYRVQAEFAQISSSGFPYNFTASFPSNETCEATQVDVPLILNVDVKKTSMMDGEIFVRWQKPFPISFDTLLNQGPYKTVIQFIQNNTWVDIPTSERNVNSFFFIQDTTFLHTQLNTLNNQFAYRILISGINQQVKISDSAQSVFLKVLSGDRKANLRWKSKTPWSNYAYNIYKKIATASIFDSIAMTVDTQFIDNAVTVGENYCYYILALGDYGFNAVEKPLYNNSQEACLLITDLIPPCCPDVVIKGPCDDETQQIPKDVVTLEWRNPNEFCSEQDVAGYRILQHIPNVTPQVIHQIFDATETTFTFPITSLENLCFSVRSIDTSGIECTNAEILCTKICPLYELPNTFTPNGDQMNDIFKPRRNNFIKSIQLNITNRWGNLVFSTNDPEINWDGKNLQGKDLATGVYFYQCIAYPVVFGAQLLPVIKLNGYIELLRN